MPYTIEYIDYEGGLIVKWTGIVRGDEVIRSYLERFSLPRVKSLRYVISDYSDVTDFNMTHEEIIEIAEISNEASTHNRDIVALAIMPTELGYGVARTFQAYADDDETGWKTYVAKSWKEAEEWLRENLDNSLKFQPK